MENQYTTARLQLDKLAITDHQFIEVLVNTPGWLKFIGDKNIHSTAAALAYVEKIISNPELNYWVIRLRNDATPLGIVTLIKRDYLEHHDIGFALLPSYEGNGYALEAGRLILNQAIASKEHEQILATIIPSNLRSISLIEKMGLYFEKEIEVNGQPLLRYSLSEAR